MAVSTLLTVSVTANSQNSPNPLLKLMIKSFEKYARHAWLILILCMSCFNMYASDPADLEAKGDVIAVRKLAQFKAIDYYLPCFRLYKDKESKSRILEKTTSLLERQNFVAKNTAVKIDSLIDEALPKFSKNPSFLLPLMEERVLKTTPGSAEMKERHKNLLLKIFEIRKKQNIAHDLKYEKLLRSYFKLIQYENNINPDEKIKVFNELWQTYLANRNINDPADVALLKSGCWLMSSSRHYDLEARLWEEMRSYQKGNPGISDDDLNSTLFSLAYACTNHAKKLMSENTDTLSAMNCVSKTLEHLGKVEGKENKAYIHVLDTYISILDNDSPDIIPYLKESVALKENLYGIESEEYRVTKGYLSAVEDKLNPKTILSDDVLDMCNTDEISSLSTKISILNRNARYAEVVKECNKLIDKIVTGYSADSIYDSIELTSELIAASLHALTAYNELGRKDDIIRFGNGFCSNSNIPLSTRRMVLSFAIAFSADSNLPLEDTYRLIDENVTLLRNSNESEMTGDRRKDELKASALLIKGRTPDAVMSIRNLIDNIASNKDASTEFIDKQIALLNIYIEICSYLTDDYKTGAAQNDICLKMLEKIPDYKTLKEYLSLLCRRVKYYDSDRNYKDVLELCAEIDKISGNTPESIDKFYGNNSMYTLFNTYACDLNLSILTDIKLRAMCNLGKRNDANDVADKTANEAINTVLFSLENLESRNLDAIARNLKIYNDRMANVAISMGCDRTLIKYFNFTLLYKQAFLTAENLLRLQIRESGDSELIESLQSLDSVRNLIADRLKTGLPTDNLKIDELQLQRYLSEHSKVYGDYLKTIRLTWEDVKNTLSPNDIVVEFIEYSSYLDNKSHIAALVLRHDWKAPKIIDLFPVSKIPTNPYIDKTFSLMCWDKLLPFFKNVQDIYFSPAGELYGINIESLPSPRNEGLLSDYYNIYRLSSSRELAKIKNNNPINNGYAAIYGGINYNASRDALVTETTNLANGKPADRCPDDLLSEIRGVKKRISYLPGTKTETDSIQYILEMTGTDLIPQLYSGDSATEASFKSYSGKNLQLAHIATHGFYINGKPSATDEESLVMSRSGLLFSGAEKTLSAKDRLPDNMEDGILTAGEISALDLRNLRLVVLSACQSALGEIRGDGVFGLQRGFKKAGAGSILMSLWKVDDEATCMLMTEFYKCLSAGISKYDALEKAKRSIRSVSEKGWDDPRYWGAFILLDGIE